VWDGDPSTESNTSQKVLAMVFKVMQQGPDHRILPSLFIPFKVCYLV